MRNDEALQITYMSSIHDGFLNFLRAAPIVFFAFVCHFNIPLIYSELRRKKQLDRKSKFVKKR